MKLQIESTTKIVNVNGVPARIWEGTTPSGIAVHVYVTRVAVGADENTAEFDRALQECREPSAVVAALPPFLVL